MNRVLRFMMMAMCIVMMFCSCEQTKDYGEPYAYIQAVGYGDSSSGKTGMMNLSGEKIFEPQFKNDITFASCDRFFARDDEGFWKLYTLEANPKQVGEDRYVEVGAFVDGLCPVTKADSWPEYIDVNGNTVFGLKEYNGKKFDYAYNFQDGLACVKMEDGLYGFVDKTGKMVVEPQYVVTEFFFNYGKCVVVKPLKPGKDEEALEWAVIDRDGNELFSTIMGKIEPLGGFEPNDLTIVSVKGGKKYRIMNSKGETGVMLDVNGVKSMWGDLIHYYDEDNYDGLMNTKGKVVLEPNYIDLDWKGGPIIGYDGEHSVLNKQGKVLKTLESDNYYLFDYHFIGYRDRFIIYTDTHGYFADAGGNRLSTSMDFDYATGLEMNMVHTDYQIIERFLSELNLSADGMMGIKLGTNAREFDENNYPFLRGKKLEHDDNSFYLEDKYMSSLNYILGIAFSQNIYQKNSSSRNADANIMALAILMDKEGGNDALYLSIKKELEKHAKKVLINYNFENLSGDLYIGDVNSFLINNTEEGVALICLPN